MIDDMTQTYGIIYGLFDPRTGQLRYIGRTISSVSSRLAAHLADARRKALPKSGWIREMREGGLAPEIEILETCSSKEDLHEAERWHIQYWISLGCDLTNVRSGGGPGSEETRRRMSAAQKARWAKNLSEGEG